jgi:hypothetical protein
MSKFNLPLLRKAVEWAESEARKPEAESEWFQGAYAIEGGDISRHCGTAYCIAGFVALHDGGHDLTPDYIDGDDKASVARDLLGIDEYDAWGGDVDQDGLFAPYNRIEDVRDIAENIARKYGEEL